MERRAWIQAWRSAAQRAFEREKGADALRQRAPTTHSKRSGLGEAGSATTKPYSLGEPRNMQGVLFVYSGFVFLIFVGF